MQKIVLDTNVLVSALISPNRVPWKIVFEEVFAEVARVEVFYSAEVMEEYEEVLRREKFLRFPSFTSAAEVLIEQLKVLGNQVQPSFAIRMLKDASDDKFLTLAMAAKADFLITGNTTDFTISEIGETKIVTPTEYWQNYRPA